MYGPSRRRRLTYVVVTSLLQHRNTVGAVAALLHLVSAQIPREPFQANVVGPGTSRGCVGADRYLPARGPLPVQIITPPSAKGSSWPSRRGPLDGFILFILFRLFRFPEPARPSKPLAPTSMRVDELAQAGKTP